MKAIIFGATGMVGQSVLRECLLDPGVSMVRTIGRTATGTQHLKLRETVQTNLWDFSNIEDDMKGFDACFFCLGVTSTGMSEQDYTRVTYGITMAAAETLSRLNPEMTFVFISAAGTDSSERGRLMWARVKGKTENALLRLPFHAAYMFRIAAVEPMHGIKSRTRSYRIGYLVLKPILPLLRWMFPGYVLTTEELGRAMLEVARRGAPKKVLESRDIAAVLR